MQCNETSFVNADLKIISWRNLHKTPVWVVRIRQPQMNQDRIHSILEVRVHALSLFSADILIPNTLIREARNNYYSSRRRLTKKLSLKIAHVNVSPKRSFWSFEGPTHPKGMVRGHFRVASQFGPQDSLSSVASQRQHLTVGKLSGELVVEFCTLTSPSTSSSGTQIALWGDIL